MDLAELELATHAASQRFLLTCAVRLSPEKDPMRFAEVVEHMGAKGALKRLQVARLFSVMYKVQMNILFTGKAA